MTAAKKKAPGKPTKGKPNRPAKGTVSKDKKRLAPKSSAAPTPAVPPPAVDVFQVISGAVLSALSETPDTRYSFDGLADALYERGIKNIDGLSDVLVKLRDDGQIEEVEGKGGWEYLTTARQVATRVASTPLGLAICRVLGEAHEPIGAELLWKRVRKIVPKAEWLPLVGALNGIVPFFAAVTEKNGVQLYSTPREEPAPADQEEETPSPPPAPVAPGCPTCSLDLKSPFARCEACGWTKPAPPPPRPFDDLVAAAVGDAAKGKTKRLRRKLTANELTSYETSRAAFVKEADGLAIAAKAATKSARACTAVLRKGAVISTARVVLVPDYARGLMVTVAIADGGAVSELKSRKLRARERVLELPFPAGTLSARKAGAS